MCSSIRITSLCHVPGYAAIGHSALRIGRYGEDNSSIIGKRWIVHIDLSGRVAIVTGAARGIGRALVERLMQEGVNTVGLDVNEAGLRELGESLADSGPEFSYFAVDITNEKQL